MVKEDSRAIRHLIEAEKLFLKLAEKPRLNVRLNLSIWKLACLANNRSRQEEASTVSDSSDSYRHHYMAIPEEYDYAHTRWLCIIRDY